jgi:hypothetical protein
MRHSSCIVLILASGALGLAGASYLFAPERTAPPMSPAVARDLLRRGAAAFDRRDPDGLMDVFAADILAMGRRRGNLRDAVQHMLREVGPGELHAEWSDPALKREGPRQTLSTNVVVTHRTPKADIVYYRTRLTLEVERRRVPRFWGLLDSEEWRITRIGSDPPIGLPDY